MSLFRRLLKPESESTSENPRDDPPRAPFGPGVYSPQLLAQAAGWTSALDSAPESLPCEGIDWNADDQMHFVREVLPKWRAEIEAIEDGGAVEGLLGRIDAAVLYAMICELQPTRLMEIGSGATTLQMRRALKAHTLPGELIAVDPEPRLDIDEAADAHLAQPVQELPLADFDTLQANELLLIDTTQLVLPGGEVEHLFTRVLPRLAPGVIVAVMDTHLPMLPPVNQRKEGVGAWALLQMYLTHNAKAEIMFAGGWFRREEDEKAEALMQAIPEAQQSAPASSLWFRIGGEALTA